LSIGMVTPLQQIIACLGSAISPIFVIAEISVYLLSVMWSDLRIVILWLCNVCHSLIFILLIDI
jgi:hypothetical protein